MGLRYHFLKTLLTIFGNKLWPMMQPQRDSFVKMWCYHLAKSETCNRRVSMSLSSHLDELKRKHQNLSDLVEEEQRSPGSSDFKIADLKKQKLRLKEEIERLSAVDA